MTSGNESAGAGGSLPLRGAGAGAGVYDSRVGPWSLAARDHVVPGCAGSRVVERPVALVGRTVVADESLALAGMLFPRTCRPVTVWLHARPGHASVEYHLTGVRDGSAEPLRSVGAGRSGQWEWVQFPPVTWEEIGDTFGVVIRSAAGRPGTHAADRLVISTEAELTASALNAAPPLIPQRPLVRVARCATPPRIDGSPDDACWAHTTACSDFLVVDGGGLMAEAQTTARLCHDDDNLYALFVCEEPVLQVVQQRLHEFRARVTERDGGVSQDDSVLLLIDPATPGAQACEFAVNALGTVEDARCAGPDLWEGRDAGWNSGTRAAASIGDGVWTVELAAPLADLADRPPAAGTAWRVALGRIGKARNEVSSWNPSHHGLHAPSPWGALVFGELPMGVALETPACLQLGTNRLTAALTPPPQQGRGVYLAASLAAAPAEPAGAIDPGVSHSCSFAGLGADPVAAAHSFEVQDEGRWEVGYGIMDAASLEPLYLTPLVTRVVKSSAASVLLSSDGPFELFLNGELLERGAQARALAVAVPLQQGANVFALRVERGVAAVRITAPGAAGAPGRWKVSPADSSEALSPALDDSGWATATQVGEDQAVGPMYGEPGRPVVLRRTVLWEQTRVWPRPDPALHIARNSTQHINFICDGVTGRELLDWTLYLAVPPEFRVVGSTGFYADVDGQPGFTCTQLGEQDVDGRTMRVARICADRPVLAARPRHYLSLFNVFVRWREGTEEPEGAATSFLYWTQSNDGTVVEPAQVIPVRLLPPLEGRQPGELTWQLYVRGLNSIGNTDMVEPILSTCRAAGLNDLVHIPSRCRDAFRHHGIRGTLSTEGGTLDDMADVAPYLQEHPDARLVRADGAPDDRHICMTLLLGEAWEAVETELQRRLQELRPDAVDYDYEFGHLKGSPHTCYCPRCLEAFREHAEMPPDVTLDPEGVLAGYGDAWIDFMSWRVAQMFAKFRETVHRLAPGTEFNIYSGYQTPQNPRQYGVDWRYVGDLQAVDRAACGYGRPLEALVATREALKGIPLVLGQLIYPYDTTKDLAATPLTKAVLLRRALDATGGVMVYDRLPMDGLSWLALAETTRLVARLERAFLEGMREPLGELDAATVQVLRGEDVTLVCVMNLGDQPLEWTIPLPAAAGAGEEFYSGREVAAGEQVTCSLEAGDAAVFVLCE